MAEVHWGRIVQLGRGTGHLVCTAVLDSPRRGKITQDKIITTFISGLLKGIPLTSTETH